MAQVTDGIQLVRRTVVTAGDDIVLAWDVASTTVAGCGTRPDVGRRAELTVAATDTDDATVAA